MAIQNHMTVDQMCNADLPYAPPFSLAIDHSIASAHIMQNKLDGIMDGLNAFELKEKLKKKRRCYCWTYGTPTNSNKCVWVLARCLSRWASCGHA